MKEKSFFSILALLFLLLFFYLVYRKIKKSFGFFGDIFKAPFRIFSLLKTPLGVPLPTPMKIPVTLWPGAFGFLYSLLRKGGVLKRAGGKISKKIVFSIGPLVATRILKKLKEPSSIKKRVFETRAPSGALDIFSFPLKKTLLAASSVVGFVSGVSRNLSSLFGKKSFKPFTSFKPLTSFKSKKRPVFFSSRIASKLLRKRSYIPSRFTSFSSKKNVSHRRRVFYRMRGFFRFKRSFYRRRRF